ncbi:MAG: ATP-dependent chaperone ClpB, partial [Synechococcaceae bacterium WBB_34_004]|nr:ATP-dependent chaperone ClpB [Synechococcaceae bacterium WBB_34_004]
SLRADELRQIVELQVQRLAKRLANRKINLNAENSALDWLATAGYDPVYGARPLKRAIQRELETPIAKAILSGGYAAGSTVLVAASNDGLIFS